MTHLATRSDRRIGHGATGEVWAATLRRDGRKVAIKQLVGGHSSKTLRREADILAKIDHDNIVKFYGQQEDSEGRIELVIELVDGVSMGRLIESGPVPAGIAVNIIRQVLTALDYLHREHKLLHRDLSPGNILIRRDGRVKLADFGLAKLLGAARTTTTVKATPPYVSPEQLKPDELDASSDLFALGVNLYELLTGTTPFGGYTFEAVLNEVPIAPVTALRPSLPKTLDAVVRRLLEYDRACRYRSARDVLAALPASDMGASDLQELLHQRGLVPADKLRGGRGRLAILAAAALGVLLGIGGTHLYQALVATAPPLVTGVEAATPTTPPATASESLSESGPDSDGMATPAKPSPREMHKPSRQRTAKRKNRPTPAAPSHRQPGEGVATADATRGRNSATGQDGAKQTPDKPPAKPAGQRVWAPKGTTIHYPGGHRATIE